VACDFLSIIGSVKHGTGQDFIAGTERHDMGDLRLLGDILLTCAKSFALMFVVTDIRSTALDVRDQQHDYHINASTAEQQLRLNIVKGTCTRILKDVVALKGIARLFRKASHDNFLGDFGNYQSTILHVTNRAHEDSKLLQDDQEYARLRADVWDDILELARDREVDIGDEVGIAGLLVDALPI
jgi:hypothetical protein